MSLSLLSDICLPADVFETFRNDFIEEYQLDPALMCVRLNSHWTRSWSSLIGQYLWSPIRRCTIYNQIYAVKFAM